MRYNAKLNKLIRSVVALVLILTLLVTASYAWLSNSTSTKMDTNEYITISADAGLNMNYGYGDNNQGTMTIPKDCILTECSSTDGKNFYFPLSAYGADGDRDFTNGIEEVDDFIYREATVLDKNKKYLSLDLVLSSESDSNVWLSKDSYIKNKSATQTSANAVRVAFIEKEIEGKSIVFDNSPLKEDSERNFNNKDYRPPIGSINRDGTGPSTVKNEAYRPHAITEYTNNGGNVLFELKAGVPKHITVNIWLEGTDPDCVNNILNVKDLNIKIKFSTSYEERETYYLKDFTREEWLADDGCYIYAVDANKDLADITVADLENGFEKSGSYDSDLTWFGTIPESIKNVRFLRLNPDHIDGNHETWNYWDAGEVGECKTFNAFGHGAGMWDDNFTATEITLFDGTPNSYLLSNVYENQKTTNPGIMHVSFELEDDNGNLVNHNYKLSYHNNRAQWQINIPSQATNINFLRYKTVRKNNVNTKEIVDINSPEKIWQTTRTDERYYTAYFNGAEADNGSLYATTTTGYWSDELLYTRVSQDFIDNYSYGDPIAAYFYDMETTFNVGVAMHAKTDNGNYKVAVPPQLMKSNQTDQNPDTVTIYFTNNNKWSKPKVYWWENGNNNGWPGEAMTKIPNPNGYGQDIYKAEIPANATGLIFSDDGGSKRTGNIEGITLYENIGFWVNSDNSFGGTYTHYRQAVLFAVCNPNAEVWDWDYARDYQTPDRAATYENYNLFDITGFDEDECYITGEWHYSSSP